MLVEFNIAVGNGVDNLVGHFGHLLSLLALETVLHKPFADKLLAQLTLALALGLTLLITLGIEITRRVGGMDFVDKVNLAVTFAKFILGVDKDETLAGSHLCAALEELESILFELVIVLFRNKACPNDLLARDVLVVSLVSLRGGGNDRCRELLVLDHTLGECDAAKHAIACLVLAPCRAGKIAAHNHLNAEALAFETDGHHRVGSGYLPVGNDVGSGIEEFGSYLVQYLAFERNTFRQDDIKCRDAVADNHCHIFVIDIIYVANLSDVKTFLFREIEISFYYCLHYEKLKNEI